MTYTSFSPEAKEQAIAERKAARAPNKEHRKCFWTWPWGHVYKVRDRAGLILFLKCAACGKTKVDLPR